MFIKICGITREEDALLATALGADAVGFIFAPSSRQIALSRARDIARQLPADVLTVGVFRDAGKEKVMDTVNRVNLRAVQLHGREFFQSGRIHSQFFILHKLLYMTIYLIR